MDFMKALVKALKAELGVPVSTDVPSERPAEFCTIERTGGQTTMWADEPSVSIRLWAQSDAAAYALAEKARAYVTSGARVRQDLPMIAKAEIGSAYRNDDLTSGQNRHQVNAYFTVRIKHEKKE